MDMAPQIEEVRPSDPVSYYRARYYDPQVGRFISEDPIRFEGGVGFYNFLSNSPFLFTDPTGTQNYPQPQDTLEPLRDNANIGLYPTIMAGRFANEALDAAQNWANQHQLPGGSVHNGAADAFRHCFWSCTMTQYLGEEVAESVGRQHEKAGNRHGQPKAEEQMDSANNLAGRTAALSCPKGTRNCWDLCNDLYNQHQLYGLGARRDYFPQ